jgi:hypothetical protein
MIAPRFAFTRLLPGRPSVEGHLLARELRRTAGCEELPESAAEDLQETLTQPERPDRIVDR